MVETLTTMKLERETRWWSCMPVYKGEEAREWLLIVTWVWKRGDELHFNGDALVGNERVLLRSKDVTKFFDYWKKKKKKTCHQYP